MILRIQDLDHGDGGDYTGRDHTEGDCDDDEIWQGVHTLPLPK
jgi:hypothetical protein